MSPRWILSRLSHAVEATNTGFAEYNFPAATSALYNFWLFHAAVPYLLPKGFPGKLPFEGKAGVGVRRLWAAPFVLFIYYRYKFRFGDCHDRCIEPWWRIFRFVLALVLAMTSPRIPKLGFHEMKSVDS